MDVDPQDDGQRTPTPNAINSSPVRHGGDTASTDPLSAPLALDEAPSIPSDKKGKAQQSSTITYSTAGPSTQVISAGLTEPPLSDAALHDEISELRSALRAAVTQLNSSLAVAFDDRSQTPINSTTHDATSPNPNQSATRDHVSPGYSSVQDVGRTREGLNTSGRFVNEILPPTTAHQASGQASHTRSPLPLHPPHSTINHPRQSPVLDQISRVRQYQQFRGSLSSRDMVAGPTISDGLYSRTSARGGSSFAPSPYTVEPRNHTLRAPSSGTTPNSPVGPPTIPTSSFQQTHPRQPDVRANRIERGSEAPPAGMNTAASGGSRGFDLESTLLSIASNVDNLTAEVAELRGRISNTQRRRPTSTRNSTTRGTQNERPRTESRNLMMTAVRLGMNQSLNIRTDPEIVNVVADVMVDPQTQEDFDTGRIEDPPLEPLRINLDQPRCRWNKLLSVKFASALPQMDENNPWPLEDIAEHFLQRIETLAQAFRSNFLPSEVENIAEYAAALKARQDDLRQSKRARKRQTTRSRTRFKIAEAEFGDTNDPAWAAMLELLDVLKIDGHSSDETDTEHGGVVAHVPSWRSREIGELLRFVDGKKRTTNEYGNHKGGARPISRHRDRRIIHSRKAYVPGLPHNLYNHDWLATLPAFTRYQEVRPLPDPIPIPRLHRPGPHAPSLLVL